MEHIGLVESLELCLLIILDREPRRLPRAALRWHGRFCREVRDVTLEEAQAVLATLALLHTVRERRSERPLRLALPAWARTGRRGAERLGSNT
jgi:hypothetical protein